MDAKDDRVFWNSTFILYLLVSKYTFRYRDIQMHVQTKQVSGFCGRALWHWVKGMSLNQHSLTTRSCVIHSLQAWPHTGDQKHILWRLETDIGGCVKNCVCGSIQSVNLTCLCNVIWLVNFVTVALCWGFMLQTTIKKQSALDRLTLLL